MAIKIGANLAYNGKLPNFERDRFATKAAMKAFPETSIDDGHLSYCAEDGNTYQFKSSNSVDTVTGKWRVFKADVDVPIMKGATATADGVVGLVPAPKISDRFAWLQASGVWKRLDINDVPTLTNRVLISGNQSDSIGPNPGIFKIATITIPKISNITGTLEFDIQSRHDNFNIMVNINYNTNFILNVIVEDNSLISNKTPLYYYVDKTNDIDNVILYYKTIKFDTVNVKVRSKTGVLNLSYTIDNIKVDTLPEGAIQVHNVNYGDKNLFYATPKDAAGDPKFRAINITDLPDLSSKYATKEKAFTKDTASTEPGQVVAGPPTTQGNLYLRKLIADDIPDLNSKYQRLNSNGYQPNPLMINAKVGADSNSNYKYLTALIYGLPDNIPYKSSPDWYFATDGSLQDITASYYNKTYLDDKFKVISASLNDLVSKTYDDTEVRQLISNNTSAIGTKADKSELAKYQPKYEADYIATSDLSILPITTGVIDLNGNQIDLPNIDLVDGYLTIMNGTVVFNATTTNLRVKELELSNVTISYSDDVNIVLGIQKLKCLNVVDYSGLRINFTEGSAIEQATLINSSIRAASLSVTKTLNMYNSTCNINGNVKLTAYNSFVGDDGLSLANGSAWYNTQLDISPYYTSGWVDEAGKMHCGMHFDDTITGDSDYAPQTKAVYNALQLKADKTQLASLATQTDFVDLRNKVNAMPKTVFITQAAYNALTTKDANTIYYING